MAVKPDKISLDLVDQNDRPFGLERLAGRLSLVYFGFLHCRAVCPLALAKLSEVVRGLQEARNRFQVLYISVDPERDTPVAMKAFLAERHPDFIGLTGSKNAVDATKTSLKVFTRRLEDPADPDGYAVPHTAMIYLVNEHGQYLTHFAAHLDAQQITERLHEIMRPTATGAEIS